MTIKLPWPPSVNSYYRTYKNRTILSAAGRKYKKQAAAAIAAKVKNPPEYKERLSVQLYLSPPDNRKRDIDNYAKATIDALQASRIFLNDSQIDHLEIFRTENAKPPHVLAIIKPI